MGSGGDWESGFAGKPRLGDGEKRRRGDAESPLLLVSKSHGLPSGVFLPARRVFLPGKGAAPRAIAGAPRAGEGRPSGGDGAPRRAERRPCGGRGLPSAGNGAPRAVHGPPRTPEGAPRTKWGGPFGGQKRRKPAQKRLWGLKIASQGQKQPVGGAQAAADWKTEHHGRQDSISPPILRPLPKTR
jgi:hypothetical protein